MLYLMLKIENNKCELLGVYDYEADIKDYLEILPGHKISDNLKRDFQNGDLVTYQIIEFDEDFRGSF